jgi:hypothetical protein
LFSAIVKCSLFRMKEPVSFVMFSAAVCSTTFMLSATRHTHTHTHLFLKLPHTLGDELIARVITAMCKTRSD